MLSVLNIRKNYEGKPLLRGISFNVEKGETICLLGHSGSGKSTLLRIIAGIEEADSGLISWDGLDMKNIPIHERNFGFMFQDYGLFPHKNVFENVAFGLRMQNYPKTEITNRVLQELDKVKMLSFANRSVTELSGGEQQRVALARALAPQPKLLMLDEPLGALDKTLRGQLLKEIRKLLHETETPAIYVTHDQEEAFTIGDRLVLIDSGELKQIGTPKAIYQHPNNAWVAGYLGLNNIIRGEVVTSDPFVIKTSVGVFSLLKQETENFYRGQIVQLLIRPDAIDLNPDPINTISGTIIDSVFLGQGYRIVLDCETATFDFDVQTEYLIGDQLALAIAPQELTCFPED